MNTSMDKEAWVFIATTIFLSFIAYLLTKRAIPALSSMFIEAGLYGKDMCKKDATAKVPESQGLISGTVFLMVAFISLGLRFGKHFTNKEEAEFPHRLFSENLTCLLCICCMLLLGFADDVLNLQWRYKLVLPTVASIPLLIVYYVNHRSTTILIPNIHILRLILGSSPDIGPLYFIYMALLSVFCTNAINIYAGINGLESGQTVVMALSVAIFNICELGTYQRDGHLFSLCILLPFAATTTALFTYNKYPAKAFVGDTFTYFAGMTFAVVGIIGHFSKSVLLFFIPQIFNFLYSTPQIFRFVPCPRHRLPRYNPSTDLLEASETKFKESDINKHLLFILRLLNKLKVVRLKEPKSSTKKSTLKKGHKSKSSHKNGVGSSVDDTDHDSYIFMNNLTLINLFLVWFGPMREKNLTNCLLVIQIFGSVLAFFIRYPLASLFYEDFFFGGDRSFRGVKGFVVDIFRFFRRYFAGGVS